MIQTSRPHFAKRYLYVVLVAVAFSLVALTWPDVNLEKYGVTKRGNSVLRLFDDDNSPSMQDDHEYDEYHSYTYKTSSLDIRKWGCHRNETPLIYVHIGKAGGGQVRARFAAAALDFDRDNWRTSTVDKHYYPLPKGEKAKFCNSKNRNHRYIDTRWSVKTYEGNNPCNATTPLGMALACPSAYGPPNDFCPGCDPKHKNCHTVYVSHNQMGSEFHWLPSLYLEDWWNHMGRRLLLSDRPSSAPSSNLTIFDQGVKALSRAKNKGAVWCPWDGSRRPRTHREIADKYYTCGAPLAAKMDSAFHQVYSSADYSPFYASLPLHRVVLVRDPWTWIMSKFFWHKENQFYMNETTGQKRGIHCRDLSMVEYPESPRGGWANLYLLTYLAYLCGDDCEQRLEAGLMTIEEAEIQAANNLRYSFSVVGLLEETDTFFDMVSSRIAYVNMSLNPHIEGGRHSAKKSKLSIHCSKLYQTQAFQMRFRRAVPLMNTTERLYQLAVQVNRAQQDELNQCTR